MNRPIYRRVEFIANIATILVAVLLSAVLAKTLIQPKKPSQQPPPLPTIGRGTKLSVPDVDWSQHKHNLILVLQKGCHFCTDSAPFYQGLARTIRGRTDVQL